MLVKVPYDKENKRFTTSVTEKNHFGHQNRPFYAFFE